MEKKWWHHLVYTLPDAPVPNIDEGRWWRLFTPLHVVSWFYLSNMASRTMSEFHYQIFKLTVQRVESHVIHTVLCLREWADYLCYWSGVYKAMWSIWGD